MDTKNKRLIVVLGMHRSGTSAITRGLQALGVDLGENLEPPVPGINEKGFYEDLEINRLNTELLYALDSDWHGLSPIPAAAQNQEKLAPYKLRAIDLLRTRMAKPTFGLKNPRTARLLPFWEEVFNHAEVKPSYVIAVRNPMSVAESLNKRDGFDVEKGYYLWLEHVVPSISETIGSTRVVVDFDLLMADPLAQLNRIAKALNLQFSPESPGVKEYISEFLDEKLRHTKYEFKDLRIDPAVPSEVVEAYALLSRLAHDQVKIDAPEVDRQFLQLRDRLETLSPALKYMTRTEKKVVDRDGQIANLNQVVAERDKKIAELGLYKSDITMVLADLEKELSERDEQLNNLKHVLTEAETQIENLNQAIAKRDKQIADINLAVAERDVQIAVLNQEVSERNQVVAAREVQVADYASSIFEIHSSTSWRVTAPLRGAITAIRKFRSLIKVLPLIVKRSGGVWPTYQKSLRIYRNEGLLGLRIRTRRFFSAQAAAVVYPQQVESKSKLTIVPYYIDPNLDSNEVPSSKASIAIHLHLFYTEMLKEFVLHLNNIPVQYDLFVSVPQTSDSKAIQAGFKKQLKKARKIVVEQVPNRGRDIAPMIIQFGERLANYEIIAHFHTKKSLHNNKLEDWCQDILNKLLGRPGGTGGRIAHIINLLQTTAKIVFPEGQTAFIKDGNGWSGNYEVARRLLEKYTQIQIQDFPAIVFPEGSMFWARSECLKDFLMLPLSYDEFPSEPIAADGTLAHALERLIIVFASQHSGQCVQLCESDSIKDYLQYESQIDYSGSIIHSEVKVLSYYLPQFHPIPENDLWHGKGFTEWTKVRAANPLFEGHYQQHIPHNDIGYYLIDSPDTLRLQTELMRKAGVHGQVFYHYWFSGKLILEDPARLLLETPDIQMPFCFCWANENWTRRWDGNENEILLGQNYSAQDAHDFIHYLIPFFKDSRYIKVEDRPVLFIYRPSSIPNPKEYLNIWVKECNKAGIRAPYVVAVLTRGATNPHDFGMDAGVERVLHDWTDGGAPEIKHNLSPYWPINGRVLSYDEVANFYMNQKEAKDFTYFRSTVPIWDNTARYGSEAYLLHGSTPQRFQEWMESTIEYTRATLPADRQFVLVNAWNEWAEGAHLEPDSRYGYSYLNSVGRALSGVQYSGEINPSCPIPAGTKVHFSFPSILLHKLGKDNELKERFLSCLSRQTINKYCMVSTNVPEIFEGMTIQLQTNLGVPDFTLEFHQVALFDTLVVEKMIQTSLATGSAVIANSYDGNTPFVEVTANGSVQPLVAHKAPLLILPKMTATVSAKNYRMRTDARCIEVYPSELSIAQKPIVTTIIRFHKSGNLQELKNALYCLSAMMECVVQPLIAAQDLNKQQIEELENTLDSVPWTKGHEPQVHHYRSPDGKGDLRSKMLNESLKKVKTRYAAFLDYDDLLMPYAYNWLIKRLMKTGKAVTFGRVYTTSYNAANGLLVERTRQYEYGYSYEEFVSHNHAPLHSFMLDMEQLDLSHIINFDDQRYMEDYLLTLQIFTKENADWDSLKENFYVGDYIHSVDREHTLAFSDEKERQAMLTRPEYMICEKRICDMRKIIYSGRK